jgi:hypothetical protein
MLGNPIRPSDRAAVGMNPKPARGSTRTGIILVVQPTFVRIKLDGGRSKTITRHPWEVVVAAERRAHG